MVFANRLDDSFFVFGDDGFVGDVEFIVIAAEDEAGLGIESGEGVITDSGDG